MKTDDGVERLNVRAVYERYEAQKVRHRSGLAGTLRDLVKRVVIDRRSTRNRALVPPPVDVDEAAEGSAADEDEPAEDDTRDG